MANKVISDFCQSGHYFLGHAVYGSKIIFSIYGLMGMKICSILISFQKYKLSLVTKILPNKVIPEKMSYVQCTQKKPVFLEYLF
jgi:hypothetical protein